MSLLGGIGSALSGFAATDLQMKHDQEDRKRQQEQLQLEGLRSLLSQNDLPMDTYVHTIGAIADLTGNKQTKLVADHLYDQLGQRMPIDQVTPQPATTGEAGKIESAIGPPPPMTQVSRETVGEMPRNVYAARAAFPQQLEQFRQQKEILAKIDEANDTRTQERQLAVQKLRGEQALARLPIVLENRLQILDKTHQLKVSEDVDKLVKAGMSPEDASAAVLQRVEQEKNLRDARIATLQANTIAIPQRVAQGWANVDANQLRAQIAADVAKRGSDMAAFDRDTKWAFDDLNSLNREIDALQKRPDLLSDPTWSQQLQGLQTQKQTVLNQIYANKGKYVPSEAAPVRGLKSPPRSGNVTAKPKFNLGQWKADHPNATAGQVAAKRNQYAGKYDIIE